MSLPGLLKKSGREFNFFTITAAFRRTSLSFLPCFPLQGQVMICLIRKSIRPKLREEEQRPETHCCCCEYRESCCPGSKHGSSAHCCSSCRRATRDTTPIRSSTVLPAQRQPQPPGIGLLRKCQQRYHMLFVTIVIPLARKI